MPGPVFGEPTTLATTLTTNTTTFLRASRGCGKGNGRGELWRFLRNGAEGKLWFFVVFVRIPCSRGGLDGYPCWHGGLSVKRSSYFSSITSTPQWRPGFSSTLRKPAAV